MPALYGFGMRDSHRSTPLVFATALLVSTLGVASHAAEAAPYSWDADLGLLRDAAQADCRFENERSVVKDGVRLRVYSVRYRSVESNGGTLTPIQIRGYAARPDSSGPHPGIVLSHGLGGAADENPTVSLAARTTSFVISYTGPGGGTTTENRSEGKPASDAGGYRMFDTLTDVRGSWFWAHTAAALRALTCLASRPDVDAKKLGVTGYSAGGVATLLAAGADDRVQAGVALSGTLSWEAATASPDAWEHSLLKLAGLSTASSEWQRLQSELIAPARALARTAGKLLIVDGSTDEFFPLPALNATLLALPAAATRISLIGNFDHGCYKLTGGESAAAIEARASLRSDGGQRMWFGHAFGNDSRFRTLPQTPTLSAVAVGGGAFFSATVDEPPALAIEEVRLWWSGDNGYLFGSLPLDRADSRSYRKLVPVPLTGAVYFIDVQYKTRDLFFPVRFSLSSTPVLPSGMVPRIRSQTSCL